MVVVKRRQILELAFSLLFSGLICREIRLAWSLFTVSVIQGPVVTGALQRALLWPVAATAHLANDSLFFVVFGHLSESLIILSTVF